MFRYRRLIALLAMCPLACALTACTSTNGGGEQVGTVAKKKKSSEKDDSKQQAKREELQRKLDIAHQKLSKARLTAKHSRTEHSVKIQDAEQDLNIATTRLEHLQEHTGPTRLAREQLQLQGAEDRYKEAQEEMTQLELMYAEEDFADKTKEIVLDRGRRRLERAQQNLEIQRKELEFLQGHSLPLETRELQFKIEQAREKVDKANRDAEAATLDQQIAILSAEAEVAKLERELRDAEEEAK